MKVIYRPQRGGLDEAMKEVKEFSTLKEMFEYLVENEQIGKHKPKLDDLYISYYGYDERIDWETYIVCDGSYYNCKKYGCPQAIGYCTFKSPSCKAGKRPLVSRMYKGGKKPNEVK